jgi:hypothetical protein
MEIVLLEFVLKTASDAVKSQLGQDIILFFLAWFIVRGTVKGHLEKIERGLQLVADNVNSLRGSIEGHNDRIVKIETDIKNLNGKVDGLAKTKE